MENRSLDSSSAMRSVPLPGGGRAVKDTGRAFVGTYNPSPDF